MKNIYYVLMISSLFFVSIVSCEKNRTVNLPILGFDDEPGYVFSSTTVAKKSSPRIKLVVQKGDALLTQFYFLINDTQSRLNAARITGFIASEVVDSNSYVTLVSEDKNGFILDVFPNTDLNEGDYKWSFIIVDDKGLITQRDLVLTIDEILYSKNLVVYLGAGSTKKSFVKSTEGIVVDEAGFQANKGLIDLIGTTLDSKTSFMSSFVREEKGFTTGVGGIKCYFAQSNLEFNTVTEVDLSNIKKSTAQSLTVEEGKVYEFVSEVKSRGLARVEKISADSIVISVKAIKID